MQLAHPPLHGPLRHPELTPDGLVREAVEEQRQELPVHLVQRRAIEIGAPVAGRVACRAERLAAVPRELEERDEGVQQTARVHEQRPTPAVVPPGQRQQGELVVDDEEADRDCLADPARPTGVHQPAHLVEVPGPVEGPRLDDQPVGHTSLEGPVLVDVLLGADHRDRGLHESQHLAAGPALQLEEALSNGLGAVHHLDHVDQRALVGASPVRLRQCGQLQLGPSQRLLPFREHGTQRHGGRRGRKAGGIGDRACDETLVLQVRQQRHGCPCFETQGGRQVLGGLGRPRHQSLVGALLVSAEPQRLQHHSSSGSPRPPPEFLPATPRRAARL